MQQKARNVVEVYLDKLEQKKSHAFQKKNIVEVKLMRFGMSCDFMRSNYNISLLPLRWLNLECFRLL